MTQTFECPSCGAPLRYLGTPTQFCTYCESTVIVPPEQQAKRPIWPVRMARSIPRAAARRTGPDETVTRVYVLFGIFALVILLVVLLPIFFFIVAGVLSSL